jgi:CRISPR-associated endonuclease Csn1
MEYFNQHRFYRGVDYRAIEEKKKTEAKGNNEVNQGDRKYKLSNYLDEVELIFKHNKLPTDFKIEFIKLMKRHRDFAKGPGRPGEKDNIYGLYELKDGKVVASKDQNLWDKLVGKCSIYDSESRAYKSTILYEMYNCITDLSNISYSYKGMENRLPIDVVRNIINEVFSVGDKKGSCTLKENTILKYLNEFHSRSVNNNQPNIFIKEDLKGYRIDKKGLPLFTDCKSLKFIKSCFKKLDINAMGLRINEIEDSNFANRMDYLDEMLHICIKTGKNINKRAIELSSFSSNNKNFSDFNKLIANKISDVNKNEEVWKSTVSAGVGALSRKAIYKLIKMYFHQEENDKKVMSVLIHVLRQQINQDQSALNFKLQAIKNSKYIPISNNPKYSVINTEFMPKAVIRSYRQSIHVLNDIMREYGINNLTSVGIELAREKNSKEQKDAIKEMQSMNEEQKRYVADLTGINLSSDEGFASSSQFVIKAMLWKEQDGICLYTGKKLPSLQEIKRNPNIVEIDHILPISISFIDSRSNKVLTHGETNSAKGNKTPKQYIEYISGD